MFRRHRLRIITIAPRWRDDAGSWRHASLEEAPTAPREPCRLDAGRPGLLDDSRGRLLRRHGGGPALSKNAAVAGCRHGSQGATTRHRESTGGSHQGRRARPRADLLSGVDGSPHIAPAGLEAFVADADARAATRFRVRIGSYASRDEARRAAERLTATERLSTYVTLR